MVVQELLQRRQEPWRWRVQWPAIGSWQQPTESNHRSWSSYNFTRSCPRTQRQPFYGHQAFEANWKGENSISGCLMSWWKFVKSSLWSHLLLFYPTTNHFSIRLDFMRQPAQWLNPEEAPKHFPKPNLHQRKVMVTVWWSAAYLIHYSFLSPGETITSEKYAQQINEMHQKLQCLQPALVNRKSPILLHNNAQLRIVQPALQKWNLVVSGESESVFPAENCQDAWSGSLVNWQEVRWILADEAKLHSPICSTFEALVVRHVVRCYYGEELGPFCWSVLATGIAVFGASHWFAEHTSQM